jgi:hypothetical protein
MRDQEVRVPTPHVFANMVHVRAAPTGIDDQRLAAVEDGDAVALPGHSLKLMNRWAEFGDSPASIGRWPVRRGCVSLLKRTAHLTSLHFSSGERLQEGKKNI